MFWLVKLSYWWIQEKTSTELTYIFGQTVNIIMNR
jgi:hypothetical protein